MEADRILDLIDEVKYNIVMDENSTKDIDKLNEVKEFIKGMTMLLDGAEALDESPEAMRPIGGWNIYDSEVTIVVSSDSGISHLIESREGEDIPPSSEG